MEYKAHLVWERQCTVVALFRCNTEVWEGIRPCRLIQLGYNPRQCRQDMGWHLEALLCLKASTKQVGEGVLRPNKEQISIQICQGITRVDQE